MAAAAVVSNQSLEDRIHLLHRQSADLGLRAILEEAMQLSSDGRGMEAAALVEKAEAMSSLASHQQTGPKEVPPAAAQPLAARLASEIANGLINVLVRAFQDLEHHITNENGRLSSTFGERLDKLQNSVASLQPLNERLDDLVQAGTAAQERFEQLTATAASLQESHARLDREMGALKAQMDQVSASTSNRVDETCRRMDTQEREISTMNSGISELVSKVAAAADRLERHASAIRTIHDSHQDRAAVLGQVGELLDRLKSAPVPVDTIAL
jgi:uncharacterized phage infection (PIP) family protein YhgE